MDRWTRHFVESFVGPVPPDRFFLIHAPCRVGGIGLRAVGGFSAIIANVASIIDSASVASHLFLGKPPGFFSDKASPAIASLEDLEISLSGRLSRTEKFLLRQLDERGLREASESVRSHAKRWSSPLGSSPLNPVFSLVGQYELPRWQFNLWLSFRLGLPLASGTIRCRLCGKVDADPEGNHTLSCMGNNDKHTWHAHIVKAVRDLASTACWRAPPEPHPFPNDPSLRLDIAFPAGTASEKTTLIDVSITHASSVKVVYEKKLRKYQHLLSPDQELVPLVFETSGACAKPSVDLLKKLASAAMTRGFVLGGRAAPFFMVGARLARCVGDRLAKQFIDCNVD